ncbi:MAG: hypothetical protein E7307_03495 [Butyrivibrio sp.]|nr:hypothetical protein [Butyrivibrio sp.]
MATNINAGINQYNNVRQAGSMKNASGAGNARGPSKGKAPQQKQVTDKLFGESAKIELSPEVEKYGKVVDLLQKKYDNAEVFVAGPGDDLSQIGGDLEYSIILSEDELNILASEDPKDKEAKDKLLGRIDDAMKTISDMSEKIGESTGENDEISNFGITIGKDGKMNFFADINGNAHKADSLDGIIKSLAAARIQE